VYPFVSVPVWVSGFVTTTFTAPAAWLPVVPCNWVEETKVTPVAATPPMESVAPETKFVPLTVIVVPPAVVPLVGLTEVTVGAGPR
jgi:hypothetical protein